MKYLLKFKQEIKGIQTTLQVNLFGMFFMFLASLSFANAFNHSMSVTIGMIVIGVMFALGSLLYIGIFITALINKGLIPSIKETYTEIGKELTVK